MLEQSIRNPYQIWLVDPVARWIGYHLSPITITILSGIIGLIFIPLIAEGYSLSAIIVLLISGYLDTLDGTLARFQKTNSDVGSLLDLMTDRVVEFAAVLGFYLLDPTHHALAAILMLGSMLICITSFLAVGIFTANDSHKSFHYSPGLMERAEAFIFFIVMSLVPSAFVQLAYIFSALVLLTAILRIYQFIQQYQNINNLNKTIDIN